MSTQVTPEAEVTPPENGTTTPSTTSTPESSSVNQPATLPTNQPTAPPINPDYVRALEDTLRENNRQIQLLQDQVERRPAAPATPAPTLTPEEERNAFFNNPKGETRNIVAEEMGKQLAPLLEFVKQVPRPGNETLKNRIKYDPRYASYFSQDPLVEQAFDAVVANTPRVDEGVAHAIMSQVIGWQVTGQLRTVLGLPNVPVTTQPAPTPTPTTMPNQPAPPYMPPTAPATPRTTPTKSVRELTENERRLARERGMSPEQYLQWLEVPADQVVRSDIGRTR